MISDSAGTADRLIVGGEFSTDLASLECAGTDLLLRFNDSSVLRIAAQFSAGKIETIEDGSGATLNVAATLTGGIGNDLVVGGSADETLTGNAGNDTLWGNGVNDILNGNAGADKLIGGAGNDRMTGATESDRFVFGPVFGNDLITDFAAGAGSDDQIDLTAFGVTFGDLIIQQVAANTVITSAAFAGHTITLQNVNAATVPADDFLL